jgi:hypothetical protein
MITEINKVRFRGGKVTDRRKVIAPASTGDISNDKNTNLTRSMESLMNSNVSDAAGTINTHRNERSVLA